MYVIERKMKVEKAHSDSVVERLSKPSIITKFKGFEKIDIFVNKKHSDYNEITVMTYFQTKKDFYRWEGSPKHIAMHKDKANDHNKKPEGVIEVTRSSLEHILTKSYDGQ